MFKFQYLRGVTTLNLDADKCSGCGMCIEVCPQGVLYRSNGRANIHDRDSCMECGACRMNCPTGAIYVKSGVGCASAVINALLGRTDASCCAIDSECGTKKNGDFPIYPSGC